MIETRNDVDQLTEAAVARARTILTEADKVRDRRGSANQRRFARLLQDPAAVGVTMSLTDEVMRISDAVRASKALRRAAQHASPKGLGLRDAVGLRSAWKQFRETQYEFEPATGTPAQFAAMKPGALLVNTARGPVIEGEYLYFCMVHKAAGTGSELHYHPNELLIFPTSGQINANAILRTAENHNTRLMQGTCWSAGCHEAPHGSNASFHFRN